MKVITNTSGLDKLGQWILWMGLLLPVSLPAQIVDKDQSYGVYAAVLGYLTETEADPKDGEAAFYVHPTTTVSGFAEYNYRDPNYHQINPETNALYTDRSWQLFLTEVGKLDQIRNHRVHREKLARWVYPPDAYRLVASQREAETARQFVPHIRFSPVVFSPDFTKAFLYYHDDTSGYFIYLEKEADKWQTVARYLLWIT